MPRLKNWLKDIAYPFTAIVIVSILITLFLHWFIICFMGYNILTESDPSKKVDNLIKLMATSISITGFASIILTIIQSRKSIQKEVHKSSIELFKELRNESFIDTRRRAWIVKDKWFEEEGYKEKLMAYNFSKRGKVHDVELDADIKVCYQLLEFYLLVSLYDDNDQMLKSLRYFYYGWWRPFLYAFAKQVENSTVTDKVLKGPGITYLQDISYIASLERLDRLCGLQHIPNETFLHYDGG